MSNEEWIVTIDRRIAARDSGNSVNSVYPVPSDRESPATNHCLFIPHPPSDSHFLKTLLTRPAFFYIIELTGQSFDAGRVWKEAACDSRFEGIGYKFISLSSRESPVANS